MNVFLINPLLTGFFLGLSLIVAIGAQNVFVLRQGIIKEHIFSIALFCSIADSFLIISGVAGISYLLSDFFVEFSKILFGFSALWLIFYGLLKLRSALIIRHNKIANKAESTSLFKSILIVALFTFANPHVYLDTVILIGSISQKYIGIDRIYFAVGACLSSFIWFFSIGYGAKILAPVMQNKSNLKKLDLIIALIMFVIALNLLSHGGWV